METERLPDNVQPAAVKVVRRKDWIFDLLLILVLLAGLYLRLVGVNWDDYRHLHPDERFLTLVESAISPVKSLGDFFNTSESTLNPNNVGYGFFVYGTLPIFMVRYVGQWMNQAGYDQIHLVGRQLSAVSDLLTVLMVYLIAVRLYNRRVGLLAAAFAAFSVLPIQLSHFFTVDTFTNFFGFVAVYFAVVILTRKEEEKPTVILTQSQEGEEDEERDSAVQPSYRAKIAVYIRLALPYVMFGLALGMATASKINAALLALLLPLVAVIIYRRTPPAERKEKLFVLLVNLALAALISLVAFRVCQPYAFSGPGFFGIKLNPKWLQTMQSLIQQSSGDVDFPPALQWARRPVWFSWQNMVEWGLGLPLGLTAWIAFVWMAWRSLKGEWSHHLVLWGWTAVYFAYESLSWTSTMRYQMLVYPSLAIIAAWGIVQIWDRRQPIVSKRMHISTKTWRVLAVVIGAVVLLGTAAWAFAFTRIYTRPLTRNAASLWIYQNVPAAINLKISTASSAYSQPIAYHFGALVTRDQSYSQVFLAQMDGILTEVQYPSIVDQVGNGQSTLLLTITTLTNPDQVLATAVLNGDFPAGSDRPGKEYGLPLDTPVPLRSGDAYIMKIIETQGEGSLSFVDPATLTLLVDGKLQYQSLPAPVQTLEQDKPFTTNFTAAASGVLDGVYLPHVVDQSAGQGNKTLTVEVVQTDGAGVMPDAVAAVDNRFELTSDGRGLAATLTFAQPLQLEKGKNYSLILSLSQGTGDIALYGSAPALESTWDDALPQPLEGYWPYDFASGLYQGDLNFEMYWPDDAAKLARFETTLDQADYLFISSNRQWGTTVRVPERYPLTAAYYRALLGCPENKDILWCYQVARPGVFSGTLGYDLVNVTESDPNLGPIKINDQSAEEAFTVYDHPKVLIFKKNTSYQPAQVSALLGAVDLTHVVNVTPRQAGKLPAKSKLTLMLSSASQAVQQAGGTWSDLFSRMDLQNRFPGLGVVLWYLGVSLLGLLTYPIVRIALPGLPDRGYPLARLVGMLLLAYIVWLAGSYGIPYTRLTINLAVIGIALVGGILGYLQRDGLRQEWKEKKKYFLTVEGIALAFFLLFLLIRLGNSDLWHPYHGGEKPMDFSYLNAVIKSTTFPPYDPWFAGGYLNYYYYGFVIVGTLIKWLGIMPTIAYNLALPLLYSVVAMGAFCIGWNVTVATRKPRPLLSDAADESGDTPSPGMGRELLIGLAAAFGLVLLGNLGTVRMIWQGFQRLTDGYQQLAASGFDMTKASILSRWAWSFQGAIKFIQGAHLPYGAGDWYWIPSRTIPNEPITEFPMFTFLYADLHAHMIALPITIMVLAWGLAVILGRNHWGEPDGRLTWVSIGASFILAGMTIGALRPTNYWDFPVYLVLAVVALIFTLWRYFTPPKVKFLGISPSLWKPIVILGSAGVLVGLSFIMYEPFARMFGQGYNAFDFWKGDRTPFWSYITHWGLFLFMIVFWMGYETYHWMATTPMSSLSKIKPYSGLILVFLTILLAGIFILTVQYKVQIAWLVLILAAWAGVLLLRPGMPDAKRMVLFLTGTALFITLLVEMIALRGDLGRMNVVFKFYYQCWTLFAVSAAASLAWLLEAAPSWNIGWRSVWSAGATLLVAGAALFPIFAAVDKITNRMSPVAPRTLDGMTYMAYAEYNDQGNIYPLNDDYKMIIWMQEHIQGSPVIVEGNTPEYRWGSRFTIYTGLPGVVGWNYHQRQQRAILSSEVVTDRVAAINGFYSTNDPQAAKDFLAQYNVSFILVGNLERANYPGTGLNKFGLYNGKLWQEVHREGNTVIYQVLK